MVLLLVFLLIWNLIILKKLIQNLSIGIGSKKMKLSCICRIMSVQEENFCKKIWIFLQKSVERM